MQQQEGANREKVAVHTLLEGLQEANRQVRHDQNNLANQSLLLPLETKSVIAKIVKLLLVQAWARSQTSGKYVGPL